VRLAISISSAVGIGMEAGDFRKGDVDEVEGGKEWFESHNLR
jgi:hypothetical protein